MTVNPNIDNTPFHEIDKMAPIMLNRSALKSHGYIHSTLPKLLLLFHHNNLKNSFDIVSFREGFLDSDNDGLLDQWELKYFKDIAKVDRTTDYDGDSFPDSSEFFAGTNPLDDQSLLRFTLPVDVIGQKVLLRWDSVPNKRYRIERSNGNYGEWKVLASGLLADSNTMSYIDLRINNSLPVFYKLAVEGN